MRTAIALFSIAVILIVLGINVWAWIHYGHHEETVSANFLRWIEKSPIIAVLIGGVAAHLCDDHDARPVFLLGVVLAWIFWK